MNLPCPSRTVVALSVLIAVSGCGNADGDHDTSGDPETESEDSESSDTGTDSDTDEEALKTCADSISGTVVIPNGDLEIVTVIVCIGVCFEPITTDAQGHFEWHHPIGGDFDCIPYAFEETPLHIELRVSSAPEAFAEYAFLTVPTQETVSDNGTDDFDLDIGELAVYALPEESATYTSADGAEIDLSGLTATIPPDGLIKQDGGEEISIDYKQAVRVFEAPLDEWTPPFADVPLSALYFMGPRWARLAGDGVPLTIDAPPGLEEGDEVPVYLLGSYGSDWGDPEVSDDPDFLYVTPNGRCVNDTGEADLDWTADGVFQPCGTATVENGRLTTPPLPRLTWVGLGR